MTLERISKTLTATSTSESETQSGSEYEESDSSEELSSRKRRTLGKTKTVTKYINWEMSKCISVFIS